MLNKKGFRLLRILQKHMKKLKKCLTIRGKIYIIDKVSNF